MPRQRKEPRVPAKIEPKLARISSGFDETDPITPADLAATLFWRFGLDPRKEMSDLTGRPYKLADGQPIERLFA